MPKIFFSFKSSSSFFFLQVFFFFFYFANFWPLWNLPYRIFFLCLIEGNDCNKLFSSSRPLLNTGFSPLVFARGDNPSHSLHKCANRGREHRRPEGKGGVNHLLLSHCQDEGRRVQIGWTVCMVGVGYGILCRRGTGGTPDSAGTSHPRIYHSATVTAGQRTDVSVYPRATSDCLSLTLVQTV